MAQNIKPVDDKPKSQPTRDVESMLSKALDKDLTNEPEETEDEFLKYIREDAGL
jgi:hypothetical protein